jgi:integrase
MDFTDIIKKTKPNASANSIKTYNSLLRTIYKNVFGNDKEPDIKNFSKSKEILDWLNQKPYNTRKTYLAALVSIEPNEPKYKAMMLEDVNKYNEEVSKSEMTDKLENAAINEDEINKLRDELKHNTELIWKRKALRVPDFMEIQNYIIFSLYYGHIVPRRAIDYTEMLHQNYNKETDNYIDLKKKKLVFNKFKTAKFKGTQVLDIPPSLLKILSKWISLIPKEIDHLLFNAKLEPLSNVVLNQRLNQIFGDKKSVNALRHFYLTSKYKTLMKEKQKMEEDMNNMGSSSKQADVYIKVNDKE